MNSILAMFFSGSSQPRKKTRKRIDIFDTEFNTQRNLFTQGTEKDEAEEEIYSQVTDITDLEEEDKTNQENVNNAEDSAYDKELKTKKELLESDLRLLRKRKVTEIEEEMSKQRMKNVEKLRQLKKEYKLKVCELNKNFKRKRSEMDAEIDIYVKNRKADEEKKLMEKVKSFLKVPTLAFPPSLQQEIHKENKYTRFTYKGSQYIIHNDQFPGNIVFLR
eukprot:snap_masked-scaffold_5-processed-gene-19.43-mRNA-1 protein AED:1.00 eAED:1.00 QI:0/-1/0/0/-1/1/1/0/218